MPSRIAVNSVHRAWLFLGFILTGSLVVGLWLAGVFDSKLSARRTAQLLGEPSFRSVVCRPYKGDYWDYTCVIHPRTGRPFSLDVRVNGSEVTDQTAP